tara:strand:- start:573 stop:710 length:138 start_codon:yes stop_codon:yes gene_type:complete
MKNSKRKISAKEFKEIKKSKNYAILVIILLVCLAFYLITIIRTVL